jgi:hypothetical protein
MMRTLIATLTVATVVLGAAEAEESPVNLLADTLYVRTDLGLVHGVNVGSGNEYDPSEMVSNTDIIVVTINYRLGVFGFLALPALDAGGAALALHSAGVPLPLTPPEYVKAVRAQRRYGHAGL